MSLIQSSNTKKIRNVADVAKWRLCSGCGACAAVCKKRAINLLDVEDQGIRPVVNMADCSDCGSCLEVCPGISLSHKPFDGRTIPELRSYWGPVLEVWGGYATDPEIRFKGSSGGIVTALALFCLTQMGIDSVLQIGADPEKPLVNVPVFSRNRDQLVAQTGSRYSPAAPCAGLDTIEAIDSHYVFVGRPCDVAGLRKAQSVNSVLASRVFLSISIFCAGTPSSKGTKTLLDRLNVKPQDVKEIRYRGCGWPGRTTVKLQGTNGRERQMSYEQSWGEILSRHVPLRCRLCPDGTGEFADISCGDAWYKQTDFSDPGQSLVLVRTERGREVLRKAMQAGYVSLSLVGSSAVTASQASLLNRRCQLWGRLLAMRMAHIPIPRFERFSLFADWRHLSLSDKIRSIAGTLRRVMSRQLYRSSDFFPADTEAKNVVPTVLANTKT